MKKGFDNQMIGIWIMFAIGLMTLIYVPLLAFSWIRIPFPGFLVEQTMVVSSNGNPDWNGHAAGMAFPQRVIRINDVLLNSSQDLIKYLGGTQVGQNVDVQVEYPEGNKDEFSNIVLISFPRQDFLILFGVPYLIGVVFMLGGFSVFMIRNKSVAGRAFSYFCVNTALVLMLLFDLWTTHVETLIWTFAIAQIGGSLFGLAAALPENVSSAKFVQLVRIVAYGVSFALAFWGCYAVLNTSNPWAYVEPWRFSYLYSAAGIITLIIAMLLRLRMKLPQIAREQVRIILWGSLLAFTPVAIWLVGSSLRLGMTFNPIIYLTSLLLFPLSIGIAVVRYKLWDVELIIRRTAFYTILTLILISLYLLMVVWLGGLVESYTDLGELFSIMATFVIVAIFTPLRNFIQRIFDWRFNKQKQAIEQMFEEFNDTLRVAVDIDDVSQELVRVVDYTMRPEFISFWLVPPAVSETSEDTKI